MNKSLFLSILMAVAMLIVCPLQMWADADPVVYAADGAYEIDDAAKWNTFVSLVDGGQYNLNARLTADITDSVTTMVGLTEAKAYTGVFDGQDIPCASNSSLQASIAHRSPTSTAQPSRTCM